MASQLAHYQSVTERGCYRETTKRTPPETSLILGCETAMEPQMVRQRQIFVTSSKKLPIAALDEPEHEPEAEELDFPLPRSITTVHYMNHCFPQCCMTSGLLYLFVRRGERPYSQSTSASPLTGYLYPDRADPATPCFPIPEAQPPPPAPMPKSCWSEL